MFQIRTSIFRLFKMWISKVFIDRLYILYVPWKYIKLQSPLLECKGQIHVRYFWNKSRRKPPFTTTIITSTKRDFNTAFITFNQNIIEQTCRYVGIHHPSMVSSSFLDQRPQPFHSPQIICTHSQRQASHPPSSSPSNESPSANRLCAHQKAPTCQISSQNLPLPNELFLWIIQAFSRSIIWSSWLFSNGT